jgi:hypothetical protein
MIAVLDRIRRRFLVHLISETSKENDLSIRADDLVTITFLMRERELAASGVDRDLIKILVPMGENRVLDLRSAVDDSLSKLADYFGVKT